MTEDRKTFEVPPGYEAIRDDEGRATGEIRPIGEGDDDLVVTGFVGHYAGTLTHDQLERMRRETNYRLARGEGVPLVGLPSGEAIMPRRVGKAPELAMAYREAHPDITKMWSESVSTMEEQPYGLPREAVSAINGKKVVTSADKFCGQNTIFDSAGSPYMTRVWFGRLRLHIFYRGDLDDDHHDHPWDFWTFPLVSYVEEVTDPSIPPMLQNRENTTMSNVRLSADRKRQVVPAWRWSFRKATHTHRVLGAYSGYAIGTGWETDTSREPAVAMKYPRYDRSPMVAEGKRKIVTIIWRGKPSRAWGFLKYRDGRYCWMHWREFVVGGGKSAPCE